MLSVMLSILLCSFKVSCLSAATSCAFTRELSCKSSIEGMIKTLVNLHRLELH